MVELSIAEQNALFKRKSAFFKFLLSFGVILTHALNYDAYGLAELPGAFPAFLLGVEKVWLLLSMLIIPAFFFISGFSYFSSYSYAKTPEKFKRRIFTLFIPWLCWNTIMWLLAIAMENIPAIAARINSIPPYEFTLRSWLIDGLYHSADGPMWFMFNLMFAVLLSPLIYTLIRNKYIGLAAFSAAFAAVYFTNAYHYSLLMTTLLFAEAGYCALHLRSFALCRYKVPVRIGALVLLVLYPVLCASDTVQHGGILYALTMTVDVPAMWVLLGDVELKGFWKKIDFYRFWIYCSHYFPLECVEKLWLIFAGVSAAAAAVDFIFAPIVTMAILIAVAYPLMKFCPTVWKLLNGSFFPKSKKQTSQ